jgi:hypothetical protein
MKRKRPPLYHSLDVQRKLGMENAGTSQPYPPEGFDAQIEGRNYRCLPINETGEKKPRMQAECCICYRYFLLSDLEIHEPNCQRQLNKWSYV